MAHKYILMTLSTTFDINYLHNIVVREIGIFFYNKRVHAYFKIYLHWTGDTSCSFRFFCFCLWVFFRCLLRSPRNLATKGHMGQGKGFDSELWMYTLWRLRLPFSVALEQRVNIK